MVLTLPEGTLALSPADCVLLARLMGSVIDHSQDETEIRTASTYEALFESLAWIGAFTYHVTPNTEEEVSKFIKELT